MRISEIHAGKVIFAQVFAGMFAMLACGGWVGIILLMLVLLPVSGVLTGTPIYEGVRFYIVLVIFEALIVLSIFFMALTELGARLQGKTISLPMRK